jgi:alkanesulfonate monooxygenase SsuD/methylene tetrahydromethanopterin reductase-like flavin-dependent oxidoreductase (luciferase family)
MLMNAGASADGRAFAMRNCDALFTNVRSASRVLAQLEEAAREVTAAKAQALALGNEIGVFTAGFVTLRPTQREAEDYARYVQDNTDWAAVDAIMEMKGYNDKPLEIRERLRSDYSRGLGGLPIVGSPDTVAATLSDYAAAGFSGIAISFVNYIDELPYFCQEVLPRLERLGLRSPAARTP